jgi:hypothetical protein
MTQAAPTRPQHANGVCLVDDQGCAVFPGEGGEVGQGSHVTVHAKEGFGDQEFPAGGRCQREEPFLGRGEVEMSVETWPGPREPAGINNAGVVGMVAQYKVAGSCQGGENAKVGLVARGEKKHGFRIQEGGQSSLKFTVLREIAGDQARRTGPKSGTRSGSGGSGGQGRVGRKPQVVIGAEGKKGLGANCQCCA